MQPVCRAVRLDGSRSVESLRRDLQIYLCFCWKSVALCYKWRGENKLGFAGEGGHNIVP